MKVGVFLAGVLAGAALTAAGVASMGRGRAADPPGGMEKSLARLARHSLVPAADRAKPNPVADSAGVQKEARAHWADHCAGCHGNDGSGKSQMGLLMFPPAPDMRQPATQDLSDGELFYYIENGVRLTGMPAWGKPGQSGDASWKLVRLIRHLPHLTDGELREMQSLNPKTPDELQEEQEEQDFLKGADNKDAKEHHHH